MLLMIDNYDSFTWNLVHYFCELGQKVEVYRNDMIDIAGVRSMQPEYIVISPGPGTPDQAGVSMELIRDLGQRVPLLGVCLGHQSIGQVFGGTIGPAKHIMHGKSSEIWHRGEDIFHDLGQSFTATRYHSLVINPNTVPECLEVTAWTRDSDGAMEEIMAVRHKQWPIHGVQFHPESILSDFGHQLLGNFLKLHPPGNEGRRQ